MLARAGALALILAAPAAAQDIQVRELGALDPLEVNVAERPLSNDMWRNSNAATAAAALRALPGPDDEGYGSAAVADFAGRVLLSGGNPPEGGRGNEALAVLRAERVLASTGPIAGYALLERTPGLERLPNLARWHAELGFALGETASACRTTNGLVSGRNQAYWLRARAFCHAIAGEDAAAELSADLASAAERDSDFDTLLYAVTIGQWNDPDVSIDTGLELALARVASGEAQPQLDLSDAPSWLVEVAEVTSEPVEMPDEFGAALTFAETLQGAERRSAWDQLIRQEYDRMTAGLALGHALADAAEEDRFLTVARRYGSQVSSVPVTHATLAHGHRFVLAALVVNDLESARRWRRALDDGPPRRRMQTPATIDDLIGKGPDEGPAMQPQPAFEDEPVWSPPAPRLLVALDLAMAVAQNQLGRDSMIAITGARLEAGPQGVGDVAMLALLGAPVSPDWRVALLETEAQASPALMGMAAASASGAHGETALFAAAALQDGLTNAAPGTLMQVVSALDRAGLSDAARDLLLARIIEETA
ncbi:MAG: hypothetical protein CMF74_11340 [Maricaulis sp.]|jgi:hypothetical protein|nr:hypothetical protein [Maricaulis sp.]HAQ35230.1 hypothetical protein [Alphaproteobacteria bacterium]